MNSLKIASFAVLLFGLIVLISCNESDQDEKRPINPTGTAQTANQKPAEKPDADEREEGEEGPLTPAAVVAEKSAPQQTSGKQLAYSFDHDPVGQLPAKFHSAKTGGGDKRNGRSPPIQPRPQNRMLWHKLQPIKPITGFLC